MGISLTAENSAYEFNMGYSGFFLLRKQIAYALDKQFGEHYQNLIYCRSSEDFNKHDEETDALLEEKSLDEDIVDFLFASDISGSVSYNVCRKIYDLIGDIDFGDEGFQYQSYQKDDWTDFKMFLLECYKNRRKMVWS